MQIMGFWDGAILGIVVIFKEDVSLCRIPSGRTSYLDHIEHIDRVDNFWHHRRNKGEEGY